MTTEPQQSRPDSDSEQPRSAIPADSFANRLMLARAHADHLSIREAAELCELGRGAWTNWEKGTLPGDIIEVATIVAEKLKVDREWLLFGGQLAQAGPRRSGRGSRSTHGCSTVDRSEPVQTARPRDNRPPGRSLAGAGTSMGRTAYADRPKGRRRDR